MIRQQKYFGLGKALAMMLMAAGLFAACSDETMLSEGGAGDHITLSASIREMVASGDVSQMSVVPWEERSRVAAPRVHRSHGTRRPVFFRQVTSPGILRYHNGMTMVARVKDGAGSRARMVTTDDFHDDFGLFSFVYPATESWSQDSTTVVPSIYNDRVYRSRGWMSDNVWPGVQYKMSFFLYAPWNCEGITLSKASDKGTPKIHYAVPLDAMKQQDLVFSNPDKDVPGNFNAQRKENFYHKLTAVRFAIGDQMAACTIKKIEIKNVYGEGDITLDKDSKWENVATYATKTFTLTQDFPVAETDRNRLLNNDDNVFMMLPQVCPRGSQLVITVDDGGTKTHEVTADIERDVWQMGHTVTYYLATRSLGSTYIVAVSKPQANVPGKGGSTTYTVQSFRRTYYGSTFPVAWHASYTVGSDGERQTIADGGNVTAFTNNSAGSDAGEQISISLQESYPRSLSENTLTAKLRSAAVQNRDLADGGETANCYYVSAPGTYTFPLIYGNARLPSGKNNINAYSGSATFVNYQGHTISSPNIWETNGEYTIKDAVVLWQDAPDLITPSSVKVVKVKTTTTTSTGEATTIDVPSIQFTIDKANICQGNAVIALRDKENNIIWSWHIWVTAHDVTPGDAKVIANKSKTTKQKVTAQIMTVPLGYCDAEIRQRPSRKIYVRIKQDIDGGDSAQFAVTQDAERMEYSASAPYYQWGRKDPMLPALMVANSLMDKPYNGSSYQYTVTSGAVSTATAIQHPFTFYAVNGSDWSASHNYDYWSRWQQSTSAVDNTGVVKTIYDPCPVGWQMEPTATFLAFTTTEAQSTTATEFNKTGDFGTDGWHFYLQPNQQGDNILFPALGMRSSANGTISGLTTEGDYWTSGANGVATAYSLQFTSALVNPAAALPRANAYNIFPVRTYPTVTDVSAKGYHSRNYRIKKHHRR